MADLDEYRRLMEAWAQAVGAHGELVQQRAKGAGLRVRIVSDDQDPASTRTAEAMTRALGPVGFSGALDIAIKQAEVAMTSARADFEAAAVAQAMADAQRHRAPDPTSTEDGRHG